MSGSAPWLSVVGIGEDGLSAVPPAGRVLIDSAELLIGGDRHLAMIPDDHKAIRMTWRSPLTDTLDDIRQYEGRAVCVLASGDPMSFGIGVTLGKAFGGAAMTVLPAPGAFSLAASRLGWSLEDTVRLTAHGRPLSLITSHIEPGARLLILSENGYTPGEIAGLLIAEGYGRSKLTALEHLGGEEERHVSATAREWPKEPTADLNTLSVECIPEPGATILYRGPGLPDDAFHHDGQLTKQEVRAATLSKLMPRKGATLWDVGAGCGSVAIEWMRMGGNAVAIERNQTRCRMIARNATKLGTPFLDLIEGPAPDAFDQIDGAPDAIFLGGGVSNTGLAEACWERLKPGGVFVANAVTIESEILLAQLRDGWGGEMAKIAVSKLKPVGPYYSWRPSMAVTQFAARKPW